MCTYWNANVLAAAYCCIGQWCVCMCVHAVFIMNLQFGVWFVCVYACLHSLHYKWTCSSFNIELCLMLQWWSEHCSQMRTLTQMFLACQVPRNTSTFRKLREYAVSWQGFSPSTTHGQRNPKTRAHQKWLNCPKTYVDISDWLLQRVRDL